MQPIPSAYGALVLVMGLQIMQISVAGHSVLPRDRFTNVLWFDKNSPGIISQIDRQALTDDLAAAFNAHLGGVGREIRVTNYDADDAQPRAIRAQTILNAGVAGSELLFPGEVCLCLSFYADRNLPRRRGRIYLPNIGLGTVGHRPSASNMDQALDFADALAGLGGADIDWVVHSVKDQDHHAVTHAWCDDEWDTLRSRGAKATTRQTRAVGA